MKEVKIVMKGKSPIMMHKYPENPISGFEKKPKEEQAELVSYRIPGSRELYVPGVAIQRALINSALYSRGRGRASLQKEAAACFMVSPEYVGLGTEKYVIDSRPVTIPATKGKIMRHRPKVNEWKISFGLEWDETLISEEQVKKIVEDMGIRTGLLEFRPACKGSYGRCEIEEWQEVK